MDDNQQKWLDAWRAMSTAVHETAVSKGWWDEPRSDGECIALMHSELSEALEACRENNPSSDKLPAFSWAEEEFADVIIRLMDFAMAKKFRLAEAVIAKAQFNKGRPYRHGGKKF